MIDDGGQAFGDLGISLRAYLAGKALVGYLGSCEDGVIPNPAHTAEDCVRYADALIAELNKETP